MDLVQIFGILLKHFDQYFWCRPGLLIVTRNDRIAHFIIFSDLLNGAY